MLGRLVRFFDRFQPQQELKDNVSMGQLALAPALASQLACVSGDTLWESEFAVIIIF